MTAQEFIERFKLETEIISSYEAPGILDEEICDLLNISQREIALDLCANNQFDSLYSLVTQVGVSLSPVTTAPQGSSLIVYTGNIPENYFFNISAQILVNRTPIDSTGFLPKYSCTNAITGLDLIPVEVANNFIYNSVLNRNTIFLKPKYWFEQYQTTAKSTVSTGSVKVAVDTYTTLGTYNDTEGKPNMMLSYIRAPKDITTTTTTDMPENIHMSILNKAIEYRNRAIVNNANKN